MIRPRAYARTINKLLDVQMIKLRTLALLLALAPAATLADDYRFEARGSFTRDMPEFDAPVGDPEILSLSGTWYFAPVATDGVPLSEAAFLGRASYVGAIAARFELFDTHLDAQAASIGYYFPGTMFFAGAGVSRSEQVIALNSTTRLTDHFTQWFGTLGIAPIDGLLITTELGEGGYDPNLRARHVGKLPNSHFYAGSVSIVDPDEGDTSIGVDFDYFLDDSTSVGAGYQDGPDRLEVRAERFFSGTWAAGVSAYTADGSDGFGVFIKWRH